MSEVDDLLGHGYVDSSDMAFDTILDGESEGYIMIYSPKYKWIPKKIANKFSRRLMKAETFAVTVNPTSNPDMAQLVVREEEE